MFVPKDIHTLKTEHKAVLDTVRELEREGFEATYLDVKENGLVDLEVLKAAIRPDTILVSVMFVNNEVGVVQPIAEIGEICRDKGVIFHVDAAQATGKVDIDLAQLKVDLMSFSAHKTYGPKGVGALYVRRKPRVRLEAQMHGGGHERGMRSGTLAHIRSSAWVKPSAWRVRRWRARTCACARCATSCSMA